MGILNIFGRSKKSEKTIVIEGIFLGLLISALTFFLLKEFLPSFCVSSDCPDGCSSDKFAFALMWNIFPLLFLLITFFTVSLSRLFDPNLIDPIKAKENEKFKINRNVMQNTLEQFVMFFVTTMTLSIFVEGCMFKIIPILSIMFVLGRVIFWYGYHVSGSYRAPGMVISSVYILFLFYDVYKVLGYMF